MRRFCIPPEQNAAFVHAMEDVLDVYHRPYDPQRPQVCLDETSKQLLAHTRVPVPAAARVIVLVMDNLNIHSLSCLYEAFEPQQARRLAERFEIHHTPKHGSWLNVAEIFLSTISLQCLDQRIPSAADLGSLLGQWNASRPAGKVHWRFTTADARIKLHRLYPSIP